MSSNIQRNVLIQGGEMDKVIHASFSGDNVVNDVHTDIHMVQKSYRPK